MSDFFDSDLGLIQHWRSRTGFWRKSKCGRAMDGTFGLGDGSAGGERRFCDRLAIGW